MPKTKHIVAIGGGGFSYTNKITAIDQYILNLTNEKFPKVAFFPTATGDSNTYIDKFYKAFGMVDCYPTHCSLFGSNHKNLEDYLLDQDVIYVGGGNTYNMLLLWKAWKVDKILKKAWQKGIVLCGISAGSLCWFQSGNTDSFGKMDKIECLGFLSFSNSPHYNSELERRPNFHNLILTDQISAGYGIDEHTALHFEDLELKQAITEKDEGMAYFVKKENNQIVEQKIIPKKI